MTGQNRKQRRAAGHADPARKAVSLADQATRLAKSGDHAGAERLYRQANALLPNNASLISNYGNVLLPLGRADEAIACYRRAIAIDPREAAFYANLGNALFRSGQVAESITVMREGLALDPDNVATNFNLGNAYLQADDLNEAARYLRRTLALRPDYSEALSDLGNILFRQNKLAEAEAMYRKALAVQPDIAEVYSNMSNVLMHLDRIDEAMAALLHSIRLKPHFAQAHSNLGNLFALLNHPAKAVAPYREAIRLDPQFADPWSNLGNVLIRLNRHDEALEAYDRAVALKPDYAEAQLHRAFVLLTQGRTQEGWKAYEWRWAARPQSEQDRPRSRFPEWTGEALQGKRLFLHHEQGYGDTLQFCRYAADVAALGAEVVMLVPQALKQLMRTVPGVAEVITAVDDDFIADFQLPLMSVPGVLGRTMGESMATIPYIGADPALVAEWRERTAALGRLRVGLVWAGDPRPHDRAAFLTDQRRSLTFPQIAPLLDVEGVDFVSLQKGAAVGTIPRGTTLFDRTGELRDFADTAALVETLDLVIAADTSVAHVAGALGKPVWILSRFDGCWRWLLNRDDTPWYPSARLFRQEGFNDWTPVVSRVVEALRAMVVTANARS